MEAQDRVVVTARNLDTNEATEIEAEYAVGADGTSSATRRLLEIGADDRVLDHSMNIEFTCADFDHLHDKGPAGRYFIVGPEGIWATL